MIEVQVSTKHQLLGVPEAPSVIMLFPEAKQLNGYILVPHKPYETYMLRKLGFDAPSPILSYYDWPHPLDEPPFEAQRQTAAMLTMHDKAYCLNSMGTGKTRSALWAWDFLNKAKLAKKLLVVAPLSTLSFTWAREIFSTLPHRKCVVVHGTKHKRIQALQDLEADIFIINHDGVKTVLSNLQERQDIDTLVIDELAVYRNGMATRTKTMRKEAARFKWVWGMTGSPIPNAATDAWAQASIITPQRVPKYFKHFREDLMIRISQFKWAPKPNAIEKAFAALQPAVRYTLDDIVELPEAVTRFVDIDMGPTQAKVYKQLAATCYAAVKSGEITAANAGACMNKLLQVSSGFVYMNDPNRKTAVLDNDNRIDALTDTVLSTDSKMLVFAPFKHTLAGIAAALESEGIDFATMSGDTPAGERAEIFNLFQNTFKYQVLAAHPQCLAHGITLTAADTIIWFAPITSLEIYDQANMRIRRVGQKRKQLYLHFQGSAVERRIYRLLQNKQSVQEELLSLFEAATQDVS